MVKYLIFASMGFELVGLILGAYYLGEYLDHRYQERGLYFVVLAFAVLIGWLIQVIVFLRVFSRQEEKAARTEKLS